MLLCKNLSLGYEEPIVVSPRIPFVRAFTTMAQIEDVITVRMSRSKCKVFKVLPLRP